MRKTIIATSLLLAFSAQAQFQQSTIAEDKLWVSIGSDAQAELMQVGAELPFAQTAAYEADGNQPVVAQVTHSQMAKLSKLMHDKHKRCGGYIVHSTLAAALQASEVNTINAFTAPALEQQTLVNQLLPMMSEANIESTITHLSTSYANRYYTTTGGSTASNWIKSHWDSLTSGKSWATVTQVAHSGYNQKSVEVTLVGSERPDEIVVIGGHLDSTIGSTTESSTAPGADDDASGIATVTEVLRVMMDQNIRPKRTIKIYGYAAEEVGLRGSGDIASAAQSAGDNVIGVLQLDMTAYQGSTDDIVMMNDYTSASQNAYVGTLIDEYLPTLNWSYDSCGYGCSDHASWNNRGFPATMPFESKFSQYNPRIHTSNDTLASAGGDASHAIKFARLAMAYVVELGNADTGSGGGGTGGTSLEKGTPLTGLSGASGSQTFYTFDVPAGASDVTVTMSGGTGDADLYVRFGSQPTSSSYDCRPYKSGNSESCTLSNSDGTYHIMLSGYSAYSGVSLTGDYTASGGGTGGGADETRSNLSASSGNWVHYNAAVPSGRANLTVTASGGSGDADLYVRQGAQPTTSSYDCRPYKSGNAESCSFDNPAAATWHFGLRAYSTFSGVTLNWTY
jgi:leucyl aminopeptidase